MKADRPHALKVTFLRMDADSKGCIAMKKRLIKFLVEKDGPTAVEYAVMLALILMAMFSTIAFFGASAGGSFDSTSINIGNHFSTVLQ